MKKLLGIILLFLFAFSIYFTIASDVATNSNESKVYATIIPIPIPEKTSKLGS